MPITRLCELEFIWHHVPYIHKRLDNHVGPVLREHNDCLCVHYRRPTVCKDTVNTVMSCCEQKLVIPSLCKRLQSCSPGVVSREWDRGTDTVGTIKKKKKTFTNLQFD